MNPSKEVLDLAEKFLDEFGDFLKENEDNHVNYSHAAKMFEWSCKKFAEQELRIRELENYNERFKEGLRNVVKRYNKT